MLFVHFAGGDGGRFRQVGRPRPQSLQADLLREGAAEDADDGEEDVGGGGGGGDELADGADDVRGDHGAGDCGQSGYSELPAVRARPVRAAGVDSASNARGGDGGGLLPGDGVCYG